MKYDYLYLRVFRLTLRSSKRRKNGLEVKRVGTEGGRASNVKSVTRTRRRVASSLRHNGTILNLAGFFECWRAPKFFGKEEGNHAKDTFDFCWQELTMVPGTCKASHTGSTHLKTKNRGQFQSPFGSSYSHTYVVRSMKG